MHVLSNNFFMFAMRPRGASCSLLAKCYVQLFFFFLINSVIHRKHSRSFRCCHNNFPIPSENFFIHYENTKTAWHFLFIVNATRTAISFRIQFSCVIHVDWIIRRTPEGNLCIERSPKFFLKMNTPSTLHRVSAIAESEKINGSTT